MSVAEDQLDLPWALPPAAEIPDGVTLVLDIDGGTPLISINEGVPAGKVGVICTRALRFLQDGGYPYGPEDIIFVQGDDRLLLEWLPDTYGYACVGREPFELEDDQRAPSP